MKSMQIPRYLLYLMLAGFAIGAVQVTYVVILPTVPGWHGSFPGWLEALSYALNLPGAAAEIGVSKAYPPDTVTTAYIIECALFVGAFNALFYAAFGAIIRYSFMKVRRRRGGARRAA